MTEQLQEAAPAGEAVQTDAPKWAPEVEEEARALGWKAEDEWKGEKPAGYIPDPTRYLERAESFAPFRKLREQNEEAMRRIESVAAKQMERTRAEHAAELSRIKAEKAAAVETGDIDTYKKLDRQEDTLREAAAPKQSSVPDDHRIAIEHWSVDKPWFKQDEVMTHAAAVIYGRAQSEGLTDPKAILAKVDAEMAKRFTQLAPKAPAVDPVEGGLTFGSGSVASPFEKLPKDAKDAFRRFVEKGVFKDTKEDRATYAEDYNAG